MINVVNVLFVCTANISRSPYAQIRAHEIFGDQIAASSAGIPGLQGREMDAAMEAQLPFDDDEAHAHRSRPLTRNILAQADLVLAMEFGHHMRILEQWPDTSGKVFGLRQFVEALGGSTPSASGLDRIEVIRANVGPNSMVLDIADPYRRGPTVARACAVELDQLVLALGRGLGLESDSEAL